MKKSVSLMVFVCCMVFSAYVFADITVSNWRMINVKDFDVEKSVLENDIEGSLNVVRYATITSCKKYIDSLEEDDRAEIVAYRLRIEDFEQRYYGNCDLLVKD